MFCSAIGDLIDHKCTQCNNGYYYLIDKTNLCYTSSTQIDYYYFDSTSSKFINCYTSCFSCSGIGDDINHKCLSCKSNYFPLIDDTTKCYTNNSSINNYYFVSNSFLRCNARCKFCIALGDSLDNKCIECNTGYYPLVDKINMCYTNAESVEMYLFQINIFNKCFLSCKYCTGVGMASDHKCTQCNTGYYQLEDNSTMCYMDTDLVPTYIFITNLFKKCSQRCKFCTAIGDSIDHKCLECNTGYYALENKTNMCYMSNETVVSYVFDTNIFRNCYLSCQFCTGFGDLKDHKCSQCKTGFYSLENKSNMCYSNTDQVQSYYFNLNIFKLCSPRCKYCITLGDSIDHKCTECNTGYYQLEDKSNMCYSNSESVNTYIFSNTNFKKCYQSCNYCSGVGDSINHNCLSCASNYYNLVDNNSLCYISSTHLDYYYYDVISLMFLRCYQTCLKCTGRGDSFNNNCINCTSGYSLYPENTKNCLPLPCLSGYYHDSTNNICVKCNITCSKCDQYSCIECNIAQGYYPKVDEPTLCLNIPPVGYYKDDSIKVILKCNSSCLSCIDNSDICTECISNYFRDTSYNTCVPKCSSIGYYTDTINKLCVRCKAPCYSCIDDFNCLSCIDGFNLININDCTNTCPDEYYSSNNKCVKCVYPCKNCYNNDKCLNCVDNYNFFKVDSTCLKDCPIGYYSKELICNQCQLSCKACSDINICNECNKGFFLYKDSCLTTCLDGYYPDLNDNICKPCQEDCFKCQSYDICIACKDNMITENGICVIKCPLGYYRLNNKCLNCSTNCLECNSSECLMCSGEFNLVNGICVTGGLCPYSSIIIEGKCIHITSCLSFANIIADDIIPLHKTYFNVKLNIILNTTCMGYEKEIFGKLVIKWADFDNPTNADLFNLNLQVTDQNEGLKTFKSNILLQNQIIYSLEKVIYFKKYNVNLILI